MYNTTCIQDNQGRAQYADYTLNDIPGTATNYLKTLAYGNGDGVKYDYDNQGRVITEEYGKNITSTSPTIGKTVSYGYDNSGYLASVTDSGSGITTKYFYDFAGRTSATEQKKNGSTLLKTALSYDGHGRLSRQDWTVGGASYYEQYTYDADDGKLTTLRSGTGRTLTMTYDGFGRLTGMTGSSTARSYGYRDIEGTSKTTSQVASIAYTSLNSPLTYRYTYDSNGNIDTISDPLQGARSYTYDSQNQLVEEKIGSATYTYSYDNAGNILTATNSTGSHTYTYGNEEWGDLLTKYDGETIDYDSIGNPTSYYNGTRWSFGWKNGRQLTTASNGTNNITYTYGADGLRTSKTVDGVLYTYYYEGGKLMKMTIGDTTTMDFFYDQYGRPFAVKHNTRMLYYVLNEQGDVTRLIHGNGDGYATYHYDAWGNITYATDNQFTRDNPLRYRGYVYDTESQLYYCQSRYYDPATGRFINADTFASTGQGILGNNMFAYCGNNPITRVDNNGQYYTSGQIHDFVITDICNKNPSKKGSRKDNKIIYSKPIFSSTYGYCDIHDSLTGEVWELKRFSNAPSCQFAAAYMQLSNYVGGHLENDPNKPLTFGGTHTMISPNVFTKPDSDGKGKYVIGYWDTGVGVLFYDYTYVPSATIIIAGLAGWAIGAGAGAGVLIPAFA